MELTKHDLALKGTFRELKIRRMKEERQKAIFELFVQDRRPIEVVAEILGMGVKAVAYDILEMKGKGIIPVGEKISVKKWRFDQAMEAELIRQKEEKKETEDERVEDFQA